MSETMRFFAIQISLVAVVTVIVFYSSFYVYGMGVVPFDEVAVITVHSPHKGCQC